MPKQHSFGTQSDVPTEDKKTIEKTIVPNRASGIGEEAGWVAEILTAVAEFPWLLLLLFPVVIWAVWSQKRSGGTR